MPYVSSPTQSRRRTRRRYAAMLFLVVALVAGWSLFWKYAADRAGELIADWRTREAAAGRVFGCGSQTIAGYPFRIEVTCAPASAEFRNFAPPLDVKVPRILVAAQIYQPTLLISEFKGPVSIGSVGKPPEFEARWSLGQSSVRGLPAAPERVSLVTIELRPTPQGTEMAFRHDRFFDQAARDNHERGWTATLQKLERFLVP